MALNTAFVGMADPTADQPQVAQDMAPNPPPPAQPALPEQAPQLEQNKSKWRQFFDKTRTDPNFRMGVLQFGLGLMRSPQEGQNGFDVAANAVQTGINTVQTLRERDKQDKLQTEDRALKKRDTESAIAARDTAAAANAKGAQTDYQKMLNQDAQAKAANDLAIKELESLDAYRKGQIANEANRNKAYAANGAAGGGSTSADAFKINALTEEKVKSGMDPVQAKAEATREVMSTGKGNAASLFNQAMQQEIELWQNSFENLGKAPDPKTLADMQERAKERVKTALKLSGQNAPPGSGREGTIYATPEARIQALVEAAKARGATPQQLHDALIKEGADPAKYGY